MEILLKPAIGYVILEIPKVSSLIHSPQSNQKGAVEAKMAKGDGIKILAVGEASLYKTGDEVFVSGDYARLSAKFKTDKGDIVRDDVYLMSEANITAYYEG